MSSSDTIRPTYVIFGANGGIGSEISRMLVGNAELILAGRNAAALKMLADDLGVKYRVVDATQFDSVADCLSTIRDAHGRIHGVVNCAGSVLLKAAHLTTQAEWEATVATNLTSAFAVVRAAAKTMHREGGSVVLFSTAAVRVGLPNHEAIAAAKAGVEGLVRAAAATYAGQLRLNAIAPGLVKTPLTEKIWSNPKSAEYSRAMHAAGRLGNPSDIASLAVWLLQPENDWVTGQVYAVDGGLSTVRTAMRN